MGLAEPTRNETRVGRSRRQRAHDEAIGFDEEVRKEVGQGTGGGTDLQYCLVGKVLAIIKVDALPVTARTALRQSMEVLGECKGFARLLC
jgi:hypothetical protein